MATTSVNLSVSTLIAFGLLAGGCGSIFESNQAACERGISRVVECVSFLEGFPVIEGEAVSETCSRVPDTEACSEWSSFANCVAATSCADPNGPDLCEPILIRLIDDGCLLPPS